MLEKNLFSPRLLSSSISVSHSQVSRVPLMRLETVSMLSFAPNLAVLSFSHL